MLDWPWPFEEILPAEENPVSSIQRATISAKNRNVLKEVFEAGKERLRGMGRSPYPSIFSRSVPALS
jgi:hypothetical protein